MIHAKRPQGIPDTELGLLINQLVQTLVLVVCGLALIEMSQPGGEIVGIWNEASQCIGAQRLVLAGIDQVRGHNTPLTKRVTLKRNSMG